MREQALLILCNFFVIWGFVITVFFIDVHISKQANELGLFKNRKVTKSTKQCNVFVYKRGFSFIPKDLLSGHFCGCCLVNSIKLTVLRRS